MLLFENELALIFAEDNSHDDKTSSLFYLKLTKNVAKLSSAASLNGASYHSMKTF